MGTPRARRRTPGPPLHPTFTQLRLECWVPGARCSRETNRRNRPGGAADRRRGSRRRGRPGQPGPGHGNEDRARSDRSEKAEFFADPEVVKALAAKGYTVKTETSGLLGHGRPSAEGVRLRVPVQPRHPPTSSPRSTRSGRACPGPSTRPSSWSPTGAPPRCCAGNGLATLDGKPPGTSHGRLSGRRRGRTGPGSSSRGPTSTAS